MIMFYCSVINISVPVLLILYIYESPRYLLSIGKIDKAVGIINKIGHKN